MKKLTTALGALALAACYSSAPPPPPGPQQPWVPTPPVYALIGQRQALDLTSSQVTSLDSIGVALQQKNRPALDEIQKMQPSGGFGRRPNAAEVERARPLVDSIRDNNRRAQEAVKTLLSEQQRTQVCRMFAPDRDELRRREAMMREEARQAPLRRRGSLSSDTVMVAFRGPWTWCGSQAGSTTADSAARRIRSDSDAEAVASDTAAAPRP